MKLKLLALTTAIGMFYATKTKAQEGSPCFEKGNTVITAGYGFPNLQSYGWIGNGYTRVGFGPIYFKGDYALLKIKDWGPGHVIGVGGIIGFSGTTITYTGEYWNLNSARYEKYTDKHKYRQIIFGVRGTYHVYTTDKIDCYAAIGIGYNIGTYAYSSDYPYSGHNNSGSASAGIYHSEMIGIRYYFSKGFGVYAEVGSDRAPVQGGIVLKL